MKNKFRKSTVITIIMKKTFVLFDWQSNRAHTVFKNNIFWETPNILNTTIYFIKKKAEKFHTRYISRKTKFSYLVAFMIADDIVLVILFGILLPFCSEFRYLGSLIQSDGNINRDVKHRINTGWMKWRQVTGTTCDARIPLKLKGRIYKNIIRPVVMYGSECWAMKVMDDKRLHVTEMRILRWMCGVTRRDRIRNVWKEKTYCDDPKIR